jgi:hypothetical protein
MMDTGGFAFLIAWGTFIVLCVALGLVIAARSPGAKRRRSNRS